MKEKHIGLLAVQEAHLTQDRADILNEIFGESLVFHASPDPTAPTAARGVAFVVNKRHFNTGQEMTCVQVAGGRALEITLKWGASGKIRVLNVYAPNLMSENADFWTMLNTYLYECDGDRIDVMLGDFNMVEEPQDRAPARPDQARVCESLSSLRRGHDLLDGWRRTNPGVRGFSFAQASTGSQSRIDRIYVAASLETRAADWIIETPGIATDHSLVSVTIAHYADPFVGTGRWVIPRAIISDKTFMDETIAAGKRVLDELDRISEENEGTLQRLYEIFKRDTKCRARDRAKELYAKWDRKILDLKGKINRTSREPWRKLRNVVSKAAGTKRERSSGWKARERRNSGLAKGRRGQDETRYTNSDVLGEQ
ncbi:Endonuclease/exonuclease/phosphatase [Lenzites betulinus]|nr:Endonuclease/exonuclease/phosphatase [Lenzites betulinus]